MADANTNAADTDTQHLNLTGHEGGRGWYVRDIEGGTWHPSRDAAKSIRTPAEAVRMCATQPMRGTWYD